LSGRFGRSRFDWGGLEWRGKHEEASRVAVLIVVERTQRKAARCRAPEWTKGRGVIGLFYRFAQQLDVQTLSFYASGRTVDNF